MTVATAFDLRVALEVMIRAKQDPAIGHDRTFPTVGNRATLPFGDSWRRKRFAFKRLA